MLKAAIFAHIVPPTVIWMGNIDYSKCKFQTMQTGIFSRNYDAVTTKKRQIQTDLALDATGAQICISPPEPQGLAD